MGAVRRPREHPCDRELERPVAVRHRPALPHSFEVQARRPAGRRVPAPVEWQRPRSPEPRLRDDDQVRQPLGGDDRVAVDLLKILTLIGSRRRCWGRCTVPIEREIVPGLSLRFREQVAAERGVVVLLLAPRGVDPGPDDGHRAPAPDPERAPASGDHGPGLRSPADDVAFQQWRRPGRRGGGSKSTPNVPVGQLGREAEPPSVDLIGAFSQLGHGRARTGVAVPVARSYRQSREWPVPSGTAT